MFNPLFILHKQYNTPNYEHHVNNHDLLILVYGFSKEFKSLGRTPTKIPKFSAKPGGHILGAFTTLFSMPTTFPLDKPL